ncbi:MAG: hydantoinase B/oxoprolinase family protein [Planctomycetota bacterium]
MDAIRLEIYHHLFAALCEQAGAVLQRSAISTNIRERRDFSFALFDADGSLVAQAAHIPVHLGSAGAAVQAVRDAIELAEGDVAVLNHPALGGSHLPDITCVRPVFLDSGAEPTHFVVARAHHADVGGPVPGSMGLAHELFGEGLILPPVKIRERGEPVQPVLDLIAANVRQPEERLVDLRAQEASLRFAAERLREMCDEQGLDELVGYGRHLQDYAEKIARSVVKTFPTGRYSAEDALEDDGFGGGPLGIRLTIWRSKGRLVFDWSESEDEARSGVNANPSIALAASVYALRCLCPDRLPTNEGVFRAVECRTRKGSLLEPQSTAAVAGGNVETSQRLVDVAFAALRAAGLPMPASSAGTMTNLCVGGEGFSIYETLPGGAGAGLTRAGASAIQTHMTNTRNTPIEELEAHAPIRVRRLDVRRGSGGAGARRGGDGLVKEIELLDEATVSLFAERSVEGPPGADGGASGRPFRVRVQRPGERLRPVSAKTDMRLAAGSIVLVETPGGGGHGAR